MARTLAAAALTAEHRRAQLQIRAGALRDYLRIWPLWDGSEGSFRRMIEAAEPLARSYYRGSAAVAASYYASFRRAERVGGSPTPRLGSFDSDAFKAGLYATGAEMTRKAMLAGQSPQAAMQNALVRTSGSLTRSVLGGSRDTIVLSSAADKQAGGWGRVTAGNPCAFCAMVASRGPVFSEDTADFEAHDHCSCVGEPAYEGSEWPGRAKEFRDLYNRAQREGTASGTSNDALNNFRQLLNSGG